MTNLLKNSSYLILLIFFLSCKQLPKTTVSEASLYIALTSDGLTYKGQKLIFDQDISEWQKVLGKPRVYESSISEFNAYTWDDLGIVAETGDGSEPNFRTKVSSFSVYYRNLDSYIGRIGDITSYGAETYYNIRECDWLEYIKKEGRSELIAEDLKRIQRLNSNSKKKSDFTIPYKIHKKPINLQGAIIDSTMNMEKINEQLKNKKLRLANFRPAIGGVNNHGWEDRDTKGIFPGVYGVKTEFINNINYDISFDNNLGQVIYIKIRKLSKKEIQEYIRNKKL